MLEALPGRNLTYGILAEKPLKNSRIGQFILLLIMLLAGCSLNSASSSWNRNLALNSGDYDYALLSYLSETIHREGTANPELICVREKPWLRLKVPLMLKLEKLHKHSDNLGLDQSDKVIRLLKLGNQYAIQEIAYELNHITETKRKELIKTVGASDEADIVAKYRNAANAAMEQEIQIIAGMRTDEELQNYLRELSAGRGKFPEEKRRRLRTVMALPLYPIIKHWKQKFVMMNHRVTVPASPNILHVYKPEYCSGINDTEHDLILQYAPCIIVYGEEAVKYPPDDNKIGSVVLSESERGHTQITVDISQPAQYFHAKKLDPFDSDDSAVMQLTYTYWFPSHPHKMFLDLEAGRFEGLTFRVTLNESGDPIIYESVLACGCFHGAYVDAAVEEAALAMHGKPGDGSKFVVERNLTDRMPMVIHGVAKERPEGNVRPILYIEAGTHIFNGMRIASCNGIKSEPEEMAIYPYKKLENQPGKTHALSMFDKNGNVYNAERLESIVLSALGMFKAGHPRQHLLQKINFDEAYLDDPDLFANYLRIPPSVWHSHDSLTSHD